MQTTYSDRGLVSRIYKESKLNSKKANNLIRKWVEDMKRHFTKEGLQMTNKYTQKNVKHFPLEKWLEVPKN